MKQYFATAILSSALIASAAAQFGESTYEVPPGMVRGGAFIDRFLPMPLNAPLRSDVWGADAVKPRDVANGLEDAEYSYWCTSVVKGPEGKYHNFACRWPENSPKGHFEWPNSKVVHSVSDSPTGPFKVVAEIGKGHNVDAFQLKDGSWALYVIGACYRAASLDGPWTRGTLEFDTRGRKKANLSNCTFARREDGSFLMVSRTGMTWVSRDGKEPFRMVGNGSVYPPVDKAKFEDPVVWKDDVQYHLIVNDWFGRTAFYMRSADGVKWDWDQGMAYAPGIFKHEDGTVEDWHKIERPKVQQDAKGRATHMNFAVIDEAKELDKPNDNHSSKTIVVPLSVPRPMSIVRSGDTFTVTLGAEDGFDPASVKPDTLRFGAPAAVDFGKAAKPLTISKVGASQVATFNAAECGFTATDPVGKLLAEDGKGALVYSYARLPGQPAARAILSANASVTPRRRDDGSLELPIEIENFGLAASSPTPVTVTFQQKGGSLEKQESSLSGLEPYASARCSFVVPAGRIAAGSSVTLTVRIGDEPENRQLVISGLAMP